MPSKLAPVQAPPESGTYVFDPKRTSVTFRTRHMFGLGRVKGRLELGSAIVNLADQPERSTLEVTLPAASFYSRNPLRDVSVRSRLFLDVKRHPTLVFRSESVSWKDGAWHVVGQLIVKGRPAPVELAIDSVTTSGPVLTVHATGEVDRYAHGVKAFKGMAARRLSFEISAEATRR